MSSKRTYSSSHQRSGRQFTDKSDAKLGRRRNSPIIGAIIPARNRNLTLEGTNRGGKDQPTDLEDENSIFLDKSADILKMLRKVNSISREISTERNLEVELRILSSKRHKNLDFFSSAHSFMREFFSNKLHESVIIEQCEWSGTHPKVNSSEFMSNLIKRNFINMDDESQILNTAEYAKFKSQKGLPYMANLNGFNFTLGISMEIPKVLLDISKTKNDPQYSKRKRWSYIVTLDDLENSDFSFLVPDTELKYTKGDKPPARAQIDFTVTDRKGVKGLNYEIEIELLDVNKVEDMNTEHLNLLDKWAKLLVSVMNKSGKYMSTSSRKSRIKEFNEIVGGNSEDLNEYMVNRPTDLNWHDLAWQNFSNSMNPEKIPIFSLPGGCHLSLKADGTRYYLYFSSTSIYLVHPTNDEFTWIGDLKPDQGDLYNSILDVESLTTLNTLGVSKNYVMLAFDCLANKGKDVRNETYTERLIHTKNLVDKVTELKLDNIILYAKPAIKLASPLEEENISPYPQKNWEENVKRISEWRDQIKDFFKMYLSEDKSGFKDQTIGSHTFSVDGSIFTPSNLPYLEDRVQKPEGGYYDASMVRKWKPKPTIDFKVSRDDSKVLGLYAKQGSGYVKFNPRGVILVDIPQDILKPYENQIVEFEWVFLTEYSGTFKPMYVRRDKINPNFLKRANNTFKTIIDPILPEDFIGGKLRIMRNYHNRIKQSLIDEFVLSRPGLSPTLVDLGSGRGGDIGKWQNMKRVYAVEPDVKNLTEFVSRLNNLLSFPNSDVILNDYNEYKQIYSIIRSRSESMKEGGIKAHRVEILNMEAQNTEGILEKVAPHSAHIVTLFNILTFFYESAEKLDGLLNTISSVITDGGICYVISIDGKKVLDMLGDKEGIRTKNLKIVRLPDSEIGSGKNITSNRIWIEITDGIVRGQIEYLTDLDNFEALMAKKGFSLRDAYYLDQELMMSDEEMVFSSLFRVMKFQKGSNPLKNDLTFSLQELKERMYDATMVHSLRPSDKPVRIPTETLSKKGVVNLYRFGCIGDGSCYIHGILRSFSKSYKSMTELDKREFIKQIRLELSNNYTIAVHNSIGDGFFYSSKVPEYRYAKIKESLRQVNVSVSQLLMEFIGDQLNVNVYVLRGQMDAVPYIFGNTASHIKPGRKNIVLYWINENHYEAVAQIEGNRAQFVFQDSHPLIQASNV